MEFKRGDIKRNGKELLIKGYSPAEVAELLGATKDTILTYNKKYWRVPLLKKMSNNEIRKAKSMILQGFKYKEIGKLLGFASATIADRNYSDWKLPYKNIQINKKLVQRKCKTCGKIFYVRKQKLKHDACNYCCKKCSHIGAIKPDKINKPIFRGYRWQYLSREIREKNPFCQRCFTRKSRLTVHHIHPWNMGGNNDADNLLVLCDSCHKKVENVSKRMIEEFDLNFSVELLRKLFQYRTEKIRWNLTKLKKLK